MNRKARDLFDRLFDATVYDWLGLIAFVVIAAWLFYRIRARSRDRDDPAAAEQQMLTQLEDLRREGDLTEEEFRLIKGQLVKRIAATDGRRRETGG